MAHIRAWADIEARGGDDWLTPAEKQLIKACKAGETCILGDGSLPPEGKPAPERELRADVLRYLILGGCDACRVAGRGVELVGAYVTGRLDLCFATTCGTTELMFCRIALQIDAIQTSIKFLNLSSSHLNGLKAQGATIAGSVYIRDALSTAPVDFMGADIAGDFDCGGTEIKTGEAAALTAQGAHVQGHVLLNNVTARATVDLKNAAIGGQFECFDAMFQTDQGDALQAQDIRIKGSALLNDMLATGTVDFIGAQIGGLLSFNHSEFNTTEDFALILENCHVAHSLNLHKVVATATINLNGAEIGSQFGCGETSLNATKGFALTAQDAVVKGGIVWWQVQNPTRPVAFQATHTRIMDDDRTSWMAGAGYILDGFTYERLYGFTDVTDRIAWVEKGSYWAGVFSPQPFTQLAGVLREMGHDTDARKVLARRDRLIRRESRFDAKVTPNGDIGIAFKSLMADARNGLHWIFDCVLNWVVGYGHYPSRSLVWLLLLWLAAAALTYRAWQAGDFVPNSSGIQMSDGWTSLANSNVPNPASAWSQRPPPPHPGAPRPTVPGQDWERFNHFAYAADLVIPIVDLGQKRAWAPSSGRGPDGILLWRASFFFQLAGWIITALGAAAITGIIRRD